MVPQGTWAPAWEAIHGTDHWDLLPTSRHMTQSISDHPGTTVLLGTGSRQAQIYSRCPGTRVHGDINPSWTT